ncbi:hypothetical protein TNIN_206541 [Trichonephila inaurata madagascariensis]|uniref:Uncharacterized protein n=1 Tax=Trichonephila inaurata madagascariensis TaxID=2747483 RepID=A0A8X6XW90_9ARAC|nr:hypothetical protein TNIN_206541 [Trichonephila inaurata madagascariensis]
MQKIGEKLNNSYMRSLDMMDRLCYHATEYTLEQRNRQCVLCTSLINGIMQYACILYIHHCKNEIPLKTKLHLVDFILIISECLIETELSETSNEDVHPKRIQSCSFAL